MLAATQCGHRRLRLLPAPVVPVRQADPGHRGPVGRTQHLRLPRSTPSPTPWSIQ
ncbi:hypothetical protein [Streptomyces sp. NPDC002573]|uniref:hypothetical protein n=1 Tax=Streptomyces sp. NPDC002573 TaxID=3364651 RepID=UPI00367EB246